MFNFPPDPMDPVGALWHLLNFGACAAGIGFVASLSAKLLWFRELSAIRWWRLWLWSSVAAAVVSIGGLIVFGRDGKMATYAAMVVACALSLWWVGFRPGRGS